MILLGLFVISYAIKDRELPGKYGKCSVLLRPIYFNPYVQNKINATLKKSPGYIRAGVISFEALCAKSKKHQRQVFLDPNTSLEEQKSLILELTGLEKLMETYQKRLDSALRGEDPNQHQFHYKEDVINPALEKHLGELQQDMEALESKIQTTKTKAQELQLATKAYFEKTFHKVKKYFETL